MRITERQRQTIETALDHASVCITSGLYSTDALSMLAKAIAIVRELPPGARKVRSDMGGPRQHSVTDSIDVDYQESSALESRVGGAVVP